MNSKGLVAYSAGTSLFWTRLPWTRRYPWTRKPDRNRDRDISGSAAPTLKTLLDTGSQLARVRFITGS